MAKRAGKIVLYFDGSCGPTNPGGTARYGWRITKGDTTIAEGFGTEARNSTSNVAEWAAVEHGLRALRKKVKPVPKRITIRGDSQLVVNQLNGKWRVRASHLIPYKERCDELLKNMRCKCRAQWIPRRENEAADLLSRYATDRRDLADDYGYRF